MRCRKVVFKKDKYRITQDSRKFTSNYRLEYKDDNCIDGYATVGHAGSPADGLTFDEAIAYLSRLMKVDETGLMREAAKQG